MFSSGNTIGTEGVNICYNETYTYNYFIYAEYRGI